MTPGAVIRQLEAEGRAAASARQTPYHWSAGYVAMALALVALSRFGTLPAFTELEAHKPVSG
jgi:hypothetical protein